MTLNLQKKLMDHLIPLAGGAVVADVRIGLGYTAVKLESGQAGVAWTPKSDAPCCTHFQGAGTLTGRPATELLAFLTDEKSGLARAVGLATANALLSMLPKPRISREEVISSLNITAEDKVAMVGFFGPVVAELKKIGCRLDIVELNPHHGADTLSPEQGKEALANCSVAILTGTSLINGTCDELLAGLGNPRAAVLLGPSSPLCVEVFSGTKVTHVAGSRVRDVDAVLRVVSEGGGTMLMKKYVDFETVPVNGAGN
jgi:uncharacterized protein (DUF4213/DUF364 family)